MSGLKSIFEKAQQTGQVEYSYFGGGTSITPFNQTSIPFGNDEDYGAGSSRQPYIRLGYDPDTQFRKIDPTGVFNSTLAATRDTERITKFFTDFPTGPLFLTKQVGLQFSNPDLSYEISEKPSFSLSQSSQLDSPRIYNPLGLNTLAQIPAGVLGLHFTRHGLSPINESGYISLNTNENGTDIKSRLESYNKKVVKGTNAGQIELNKYTGGPDSTYGIGNTITKTYADSFGLNTGVTNKPGYLNRDSTLPEAAKKQLPTNLLGFQPFSYENINNYSTNETKNKLANVSPISAKYPKDFRVAKGTEPNSDYPTYNIHKRIGVTSNKNNIGSKNTIDSINILKITPSSTFFKNSISARQEINNADMIYSKGYDTGSIISKVDGFYGRDLIKFRIEVLNNDEPIKGRAINTDVLAFRAYIESMNDNFNATWKEFNYMGRGESFYTYEKFNRNINLTFTILAHSEEEMSIVWTKINYLMSMMAPDYNSLNQMRGNYVYLTVGDYMYRQPGVVDSLQFSDLFGDNQTGWEIALNEPEAEADLEADNQGKKDYKQYEIPKMIKVQMSFKPIHNFLPKRMYSPDGGIKDKGKNHTATFVTPNHMLLPSKYNRYLPSPPIPAKTNTQ